MAIKPGRGLIQMKSYNTRWLTQQVVLLDTEQHQTIKSSIDIGKVMLLLDVKLAVNVSSVHAALYYIHDFIYAVSWGEESLVYMSKAQVAAVMLSQYFMTSGWWYLCKMYSFSLLQH